jgi:hypothetical protein
MNPRLGPFARRAMKAAALMFLGVLALAEPRAHAQPPFSGTIFIDPDIITASDPTTFTNLTYAGRGMRLMYDRRINNFTTLNAYLFNARFNDGLTIEIQVNPEFNDSTAAGIEANKYAPVIGRLPTVLRSHVETVWIHRGVQPFGGGNQNLLIHTGQADLYTADGILEETFVHEAAHTSLDAQHASAASWLAAQTADPEFISTYARDNPAREDIAESFLPWLAVRHRPARITAELANTITAAIPNRLAYFDHQNFNLYPLIPGPLLTAAVAGTAGEQVILSWPTNAVGFALQSKRQLTAAEPWVNSPNAPSVVNSRFVVTNQITDAARFYRLRKP